MQPQFSLLNLVLLMLTACFAVGWGRVEMDRRQLRRDVQASEKNAERWRLKAKAAAEAIGYVSNVYGRSRTVELQSRFKSFVVDTADWDRLSDDEPWLVLGALDALDEKGSLMPYYLTILPDGSIVFRRRYPTAEEEAAARAGKTVIIWLERDPGRCEILRQPLPDATLDGKGWERIPEE